CLVTHLCGEEKHGLSEVRMNTGNPFCRDVKSGEFILSKKRHELANRTFQVFVESVQFTPRNVTRCVPMPGSGLFVELGGAVAPSSIALQHIELELRAPFFHARAPRRESIRRLRRTLNLARTSKQPIACIEAAVLDRCAITPVQLFIGQHA